MGRKEEFQRLEKEARKAGDYRAAGRIRNLLKNWGVNTRANPDDYFKAGKIKNSGGGGGFKGYTPNGPN